MTKRHGRGHSYRCEKCGMVTDSGGRFGRYKIPTCPYLDIGQQTIWPTLDGTADWMDQMRAMNVSSRSEPSTPAEVSPETIVEPERRQRRQWACSQ